MKSSEFFILAFRGTTYSKSTHTEQVHGISLHSAEPLTVYQPVLLLQQVDACGLAIHRGKSANANMKEAHAGFRKLPLQAILQT